MAMQIEKTPDMCNVHDPLNQNQARPEHLLPYLAKWGQYSGFIPKTLIKSAGKYEPRCHARPGKVKNFVQIDGKDVSLFELSMQTDVPLKVLRERWQHGDRTFERLTRPVKHQNMGKNRLDFYRKGKMQFFG
jgi:hypothetical protein